MRDGYAVDGHTLFKAVVGQTFTSKSCYSKKKMQKSLCADAFGYLELIEPDGQSTGYLSLFHGHLANASLAWFGAREAAAGNATSVAWVRHLFLFISIFFGQKN